MYCPISGKIILDNNGSMDLRKKTNKQKNNEINLPTNRWTKTVFQLLVEIQQCDSYCVLELVSFKTLQVTEPTECFSIQCMLRFTFLVSALYFNSTSSKSLMLLINDSIFCELRQRHYNINSKEINWRLT